MAPNRVFVSNALLDRWVTSGDAELDGTELRVSAQSARYSVEEAAHVVVEVTGVGDGHDLVGKVRPLGDLVAVGAELLDRSMVIGDLAYDVVPGFLLCPAVSPGNRERVRSAPTVVALSKLAEKLPGSRSDEELLARYLIERL